MKERPRHKIWPLGKREGQTPVGSCQLIGISLASTLEVREGKILTKLSYSRLFVQYLERSFDSGWEWWRLYSGERIHTTEIYLPTRRVGEFIFALTWTLRVFLYISQPLTWVTHMLIEEHVLMNSWGWIQFTSGKWHILWRFDPNLTYQCIAFETIGSAAEHSLTAWISNWVSLVPRQSLHACGHTEEVLVDRRSKHRVVVSVLDRGVMNSCFCTRHKPG